MAGRKQAVGIQGSGAHTRQDAGISKGSPNTRRFSRSQSISGFGTPSEYVAARIPYVDSSRPALKKYWGMPMRVKTAWHSSPGESGLDLTIGLYGLPRGLSLRTTTSGPAAKTFERGRNA